MRIRTVAGLMIAGAAAAAAIAGGVAIAAAEDGSVGRIVPAEQPVGSYHTSGFSGTSSQSQDDGEDCPGKGESSLRPAQADTGL